MSNWLGKIDFCYSHEAFLPRKYSFGIYYFIISLPISILSLSPFFHPVSLPKQKGLDRRWRPFGLSNIQISCTATDTRSIANVTGSLDRRRPWSNRWRCDWIAGDVIGSLETERCPPPRGWAVRRPPPSSVGTVTDPRPQPQRQALAFGEERERWKEEREEKYKLLKK